jgi:hypothetical protein
MEDRQKILLTALANEQLHEELYLLKTKCENPALNIPLL